MWKALSVLLLVLGVSAQTSKIDKLLQEKLKVEEQQALINERLQIEAEKAQ
jgi:hypothetical protein